MTEQETRMIRIMEHCVLNAEFCDKCENEPEGYDGCRKLHEDFFKMAKDAFAQRDALLSDLNLVCCICGHYTPQNPNSKCELKGMTCRWVWRGEHNGT